MRAVLLFVFGATALYACLFPALALDTMRRAISWAHLLEPRDLVLILLLELSKLITGLVGLAGAVVLLFRRQVTGAHALAVCLMFGAITFHKILGTGGLPGSFQEWLASALVTAGAPRSLLAWLFGSVAWTAWPTAAALLRFSVLFPQPLQPAMLDASGARDRRGFMRGTGVAGLDVGRFFRGVSTRLLALDGFSAARLAAFAVVMAAAHSVLAGSAAVWGLWMVSVLTACVAVANIRAAYVVTEGADRARVAWIMEGIVLSLFAFLVSAAIAVVFPALVARITGLVLVSFVPAVMMSALAVAVVWRTAPGGALVAATTRYGTVALALTLAAGVAYQLLSLATGALGMSRAAAAGGAALLMVVALKPITRLSDRARRRVLERQG